MSSKVWFLRYSVVFPGRIVLLLLLVFFGGANASGAMEGVISQGEREIPVLEEVDVLVVGGSTRAVSAAVAASAKGAEVFLVTPKPYLGEDMAGTLRLWLPERPTVETPLSKRLYAELEEPSSFSSPGAEASYVTSVAASAKHPDTKPPSRLTDGKADDPIHTSVQYNEDVVLTFTLPRVMPLEEVRIVAHDRSYGETSERYEIEQVELFVPAGGGDWRKVSESIPSDRARTYTIEMPLDTESDRIRLKLSKKPSSGRILLSEVMVIPKKSAPEQEETKTDGPRPMLRPLQIKKACDEVLLEEDVRFLYGCYPTALIEDASCPGQLAGLVIANRAGRQAILAKVIVDATENALIAKWTGGRFTPMNSPLTRAKRIVIGGKNPENMPSMESFREENEMLQYRAVGYVDPTSEVGGVYDPLVNYEAISDLLPRHIVYEYIVESASPLSVFGLERNRLIQRILDRTFRKGQLRGGLVDFEPQVALKKQILPSETSERPFSAEAVPEEWFFRFDSEMPRFANLSTLGVLGPRADFRLLPSQVELDLCQWMALGAKVGRESARRAEKESPAERPEVLSDGQSIAHDQGGPEKQIFSGEIVEVLHGPRPTSRSLPVIQCRKRDIPAVEPFDVVVVGGGTSGAPAGIGAARQGARTLVVEYQQGLGGVGTLGLIGRYHYGMRIGFTEEVPPEGNEDKMEWWRRELRRSGADVFLGAIGCGVLMVKNRACGVVVASERGRFVVPAKVVIDATGNSDMAVAAGAKVMTVDADDIAMQGAGFPNRELGAFYTNTDYLLIDDADMVDTWRVLVDSKRKYPESFDVGTFLQTRERRRVVGDYILSYLDQMAERTYPDSIVLSHSNYDSHGYPSHPLFYVVRPPGEKRPDGAEVFTPYRCVLPRGIEGMLVIGLGTSAYRDAMALIRMQADLQNQGFAAGLAAAQAVAEGVPPRSINIDALQEKLVAKGNLPPEVLQHQDSFPISQKELQRAVETFVTEGPDSRCTALIFAHSSRALPLMENAYPHAQGERQVDIAILLGLCGKKTGVSTLIEELEAIETNRSGKGWEPRKPLGRMAEFSQLPTRMDALILALGRTGEEDAVPVLLNKARTLSPRVCLSHHRAVALALEAFHRHDIARVLGDVLRQPGMTGYAWTELDEKPTLPSGAAMTRIEPLREIMLARALYRNGDDEGLAESILEAYADDLRGLLARHAVGILESGKPRTRK